MSRKDAEVQKRKSSTSFGVRYYTVQYRDTGVRQKVHVDHLRLHPRSNQLPTQQLVQDEPNLEPRDVAGSN